MASDLLNHHTRTVIGLAEMVRLPVGWRINIDASSFLVLGQVDEPHWVALRMFYTLDYPLWRWDHGSMGAPNGLRSTTWDDLQVAIDWYTTEGIKAATSGQPADPSDGSIGPEGSMMGVASDLD